jgi:hypothetical protein
MAHLATITIATALLVAVSAGPQASIGTASPASIDSANAHSGTLAASPTGPTSYALLRAPGPTQTAHHKPNPRCPQDIWQPPSNVPGYRAPSSHKQRKRTGHAVSGYCIGVGSGSEAGAGTGTGTIPGPSILTFGNGAGSGITTFGHSLGANPSSGAGPFGHLGGGSGGGTFGHLGGTNGVR